jgi:hypothetical protein
VGGGGEINLSNDTATDSVILIIPDMTIPRVRPAASHWVRLALPTQSQPRTSAPHQPWAR